MGISSLCEIPRQYISKATQDVFQSYSPAQEQTLRPRNYTVRIQAFILLSPVCSLLQKDSKAAANSQLRMGLGGYRVATLSHIHVSGNPQPEAIHT